MFYWCWGRPALDQVQCGTGGQCCFFHHCLTSWTDHSSSQGCLLSWTCTHTACLCMCTCPHNKQHFNCEPMGLCSQPRNADPPEQHGKTPPYGFPNYEVFPYGYAKSTLFSHPYLSITLLLYCTMRDYSQCRVFKDNQVPLERHCRHFVRLPSSQFLCQPQKNSDMQVTRPVVPETSLFHHWKLHFWDGLSF